jgi:hypothetical protein
MLFLRKNYLLVSLLFLGVSSVTMTSCDEEVELKPAPTVSLANSTTSASVGQEIELKATLNAPNGLQGITLLKNGQSVETKTFAGETSAEYIYKYKVDNAPVGSVVTFTIQATDKSNLTSNLSSFTVTISALPAKQVVLVEGILSGDIKWTADKIYKLKGFVRVGEDQSREGDKIVKTGVLTIEPGTIIIGERATKATLIIQRGSKIIAEGTVNKPIIMTSERSPGEREPGDWGGLVICGKALNNNPGGVAELEGQYGAFHGGTDNNDNSGSLKYVRVEFAGVPINPNQEVNTFTFGSVGKATKMEYLMASYGLDDSFEWFGGSADAKNIVAFRGLDDDLDCDNGFNGNVQFGLMVRGASFADQSGSNGFEVDNDGQGTFAEPFTAPTFANISIIGPKAAGETAISQQFQNGMHLRRNTKIKIYNTFVTGYPNGVYIDPGNSGRTLDNAKNGELILRGVVVSGIDKFGNDGFGQGSSQNPRGFGIRNVNTATPAAAYTIGDQTPTEWFAAQTGNKLLPNLMGTGFDIVSAIAGQKFTLSSGGSFLSGAVTVPTGFTQTTYIGAFDGSNNWTANWTNFTPIATEYK